MDAERLRSFLLTLPHAVQTVQWGDNLVFWVADKSIGGKMFATINLDPPSASRLRAGKPHLLVAYAAGPLRFAELLERDGLHPAPYAARHHWVAVEHWDLFTPTEWQRELRAAHALITAKLPPRTHAALALPPLKLRRLIAERKALLALTRP